MVTWSMNSLPIFFRQSINWRSDGRTQRKKTCRWSCHCHRKHAVWFDDSKQKACEDKSSPTYHQVFRLMACTCLLIGYISSNPSVRAIEKSFWAVHGGAAHFLPHLPESRRRLSVKKEPVLISSSVTKCKKSLTTRRWFTHTDGNGVVTYSKSGRYGTSSWI